MTGLKGMFCEEWLRTSGLSSLERRRLGSSSLQLPEEGEVERDVLSSPLWDPETGDLGIPQSCLSEGSDWT